MKLFLLISCFFSVAKAQDNANTMTDSPPIALSRKQIAEISLWTYLSAYGIENWRRGGFAKVKLVFQVCFVSLLMLWSATMFFQVFRGAWKLHRHSFRTAKKEELIAFRKRIFKNDTPCGFYCFWKSLMLPISGSLVWFQGAVFKTNTLGEGVLSPMGISVLQGKTLRSFSTNFLDWLSLSHDV